MLGIVLVHPRLERLERASQLVALFVPHRSAETLGPAGDPGGRSGRHLRREGCPRSALGGARERRLRRVEARGARDRRARGSARASDAPRTTPRLPTGAGRADTAPHTCERPRVQSSTDRGRASRGARFDLSRVVLLAPARTRPGAPGSCDRARSRTPVVATPPRARFRAPSSPTRAERPRERESSGAEEIRGGEVEPTVER